MSSIWQELLRVHARGVSSRFVLEDTIKRYLLKKYMVVQVPMTAMHTDPAHWGNGAQSLNLGRFLKQENSRQDIKTSGAAYRPFGKGTSMCPGRHLVTLEIIALTAYPVLQFDTTPCDGQLVISTRKQENLATNVFPPR